MRDINRYPWAPAPVRVAEYDTWEVIPTASTNMEVWGWVHNVVFSDGFHSRWWERP